MLRSTFFLASVSALLRATPGWGRSATTPQRVVLFSNPLTGEELTSESYADPDDPPNESSPPRLAELDVIEQEDIDFAALCNLARACGADDDTIASMSRPARIPSSDFDGGIYLVPDSAVRQLVAMDSSAIARAWAELVLADESMPVLAGLSVEQASTVLAPIVAEMAALARRRADDQALYMSAYLAD